MNGNEAKYRNGNEVDSMRMGLRCHMNEAESIGMEWDRQEHEW